MDKAIINRLSGECSASQRVFARIAGQSQID
jgi:hypothetical protein